MNRKILKDCKLLFDSFKSSLTKEDICQILTNSTIDVINYLYQKELLPFDVNKVEFNNYSYIKENPIILKNSELYEFIIKFLYEKDFKTFIEDMKYKNIY